MKTLRGEVSSKYLLQDFLVVYDAVLKAQSNASENGSIHAKLH